MNHPIFQKSIFLLFLSLSCWGCQKEKLSMHNNTTQTPSLPPTVVGARSLNATVEQTVLGAKRVNPYTVANMTAAWNQLYPSDSETALPATHWYVRFHPQTPQELKELQQAINSYAVANNDIHENDPHLFDFPLEYEIEQAGNFYHDPSLPAGAITYQYAVVKPDFQFPVGVAYTLIDELVLAPYSSFLTAEAFRRTGNDYYNTKNELVNFCAPTCPNYPNCLADDVDCDGTTTTNGGTIQPFGLPCRLGPLWPFCLHNATVTGLPTNTGGTTSNRCDCPISIFGSKPGGCVRVEDTQLGWEGVKNVEIYVRDLWFTGRSVWTTNEGCWYIPFNYFGPIQGFLKYESNRLKISGLRDLYIAEFGHPIVQNLGIHISGYNNLNIRHHRHTDNSSIHRMLWFASLTNNAVYEYDWYAAQEGLPPAAPDLNIMLMNEGGAASAPMLSHIMRTSPGAGMTIAGGFSFVGTTAGFTTMGLVDMFLPGTGALVGTMMPLFLTHMLANLPDIIYQYGGREIELTSDRVKETIYHECGHAAHYYALTDKNEYWVGNIQRIIANGGYGVKGTTDYERCALIESWGYHIGTYFADLHYGRNNYFSNLYTDQDEKERQRFVYRHSERDNPHNHYYQNLYWLQKGLYWDLMDDRMHNDPPLNIPDPVKDSVSGFTNVEIFSALTTNSPELVHEVKDALINFHPSQRNAIDTLYKEYGY
ncbi:hypothetical protein [Aureispira anguillae]|uniref:Uncharacterized protein n=1 Tax=Aureispira anguillae TaxID=2864201 RepID=A0A915VK65_9BACT|nr:hypothetical protein [Aureispira anguillae]BDS09514.1 hypothetical protein AsAng_0002150 [Aureispira anguillae]